MPIDHLVLSVPPKSFDSIVAHYAAALAPLGYKQAAAYPLAVGFGIEGRRPDFWIGASNCPDEGPLDEVVRRVKRGEKVNGCHLAFTAEDRETVDRVYEAAIKAGGVDNGKPGLRPMYDEVYYGAFWLDAMGNNAEAVCHKKPE